MITVDGPISFLVGAGIAAACRRADGTIADRDRTLLRGLAVQSLVLTPIILYFMLRFPDWEWNYLFDAEAFFFGDHPRLAPLLLALIVSALTASYLAGFALAERLLRGGSTRPVLALLAGTGTLVGLIMAVMWRQTLFIGTRAEWLAGDAPLIFTVPDFLMAQTAAGALLAPAIVWIVWKARRAA
jgi:hypothetical protein